MTILGPMKIFVLSAMLLPGEAARASSSDVFTALLEICDSKSVIEARQRGTSLGWNEVDQTKLEEWRSSFVSHNGGSVDVVGWERSAATENLSVSFWISQGKDAHKACAISAGKPKSFFESLVAHFGQPKDQLGHDLGLVATWTIGPREISFSQVGETATINFSNP